MAPYEAGHRPEAGAHSPLSFLQKTHARCRVALAGGTASQEAEQTRRASPEVYHHVAFLSAPCYDILRDQPV
jgi:hypothetical protein